MTRRRDHEPTPTQARMLAAITRLSRNGTAPSVAELARETGLRSPNAVRELLGRLRRKRLVTWEPGQHRTLRVVTR